MPIDGKCPRCGYKAPVTCFVELTENGLLFQLYAQLPPEVQRPYLKYLSLFKPGSGRAMQGTKAERLTRELVALVTRGWASKKGQVDRPAAPLHWAMGMERMQEQAATLTLPMESHMYLQSIAWDLANKADADSEKKVRKAEQNGATKISRPEDDEMSPLMRLHIKKHGDPLDTPEMQKMLQEMKDRQGALNAK